MDKLQYLTHIWEYLHPYYDSLNIPYITHYIFFHSTLIDTVLYPQFLLTLSSFFHHLFLLLSDLIILFYYFLIYFHKILFILIPYCIEFLQIVIQYHQTYLTFHEIILEIVIISLIIFYWIFKKKIILLWQYYSTKVSKKYQQLALIFPHLLFFFTASIIAIYGQKFLLPLSSPQIFPFFILICPLIYSFYLWKQNRSSPPATPPSQSDSNATSTSPTPSIDIIKYNKLQQDMVVLWTIIGSYLAISSLLTMIPFSNYFLHFIPAIREFSLVVSSNFLLFIILLTYSL